MSTKPDTETGWSKEDPKVDGVYWWRADTNDNDPDIHSVVNGRFYEVGMSQCTTVENFGGEWLGPFTASDFEQLRQLRQAAVLFEIPYEALLMDAAETLEEIAERFAHNHCLKAEEPQRFERLRSDVLSCLRNERERAARFAEKTILHLADVGISELNWQDLYNIPATIREGKESYLMSEKKTDYRLPDCECATPCELSDAWRCARDKGLSRLACDCECHNYIRKQVAGEESDL